ncbi:MAG: hypothetical protein KC593_00475 [Myxococcales bacterium]|nr:hypothetical protein [Myxococcales bacterium]
MGRALVWSCHALAPLLLVGCVLDANNAPSRGVEVRVTTDESGFVVSWPAGAAVEVQVGRCSATCAETAPADPSSEFSELIPAPEFAELSWHVSIPAGAAPPLRLGPTPGGGTVLVPFVEPEIDSGAWAVFVVVETPRAQDVLTQVGVARLN